MLKVILPLDPILKYLHETPTRIDRSPRWSTSNELPRILIRLTRTTFELVGEKEVEEEMRRT